MILKHSKIRAKIRAKILVLIGIVFFSFIQTARADDAVVFSSSPSPSSLPASASSPSVTHRAGFAGKYLSSHFAQSLQDWDTANHYLGEILMGDADNLELSRRSMILGMGSGDLSVAVQRAKTIVSVESGNGLARMILAVNDMVSGNMDTAVENLDQMEPGDMTDFIKPILKGWAAADQGVFDVAGFNETTIHSYHGALLSVFLHKDDTVDLYIQKMMEAGRLSNMDTERTADLLVVAGHLEEAKTLYEGVHAQDTQKASIIDKLSAIKEKDGGNIKDLVEPLQIKRVQDGAALALYDMAFILYQEQSDSSAKLFDYMALALNPDRVEAHLLLADTLIRHGRFDAAISELNTIPEDHPSYLAVQRHVADLLSESGRYEDALEKMNSLFMNYNDVDSLIMIGDLYRGEEKFDSALNAYNKAKHQIGDTIPEKYWYLLYARGMAYERQGDWKRAESDLKAALVYRPNHPYLLNYLGYAWADQGLHLEDSLALIKRAASLRPRDGYIIDSLGWAQYRMGSYEEALPNLERAAQLLPYDTTINDHLGDVYWRAGRRIEARFQWERALNYGEKTENPLQEKLEHKLRFGPDSEESPPE